MFGPSGDLFVSGAIAVSTFGFLDLSILAPTRVYYAMAADRLFVPALARLHPRFGTPSLAIIVQSTWSCILALTGTYDQLANYVVFADWIFFGLTVLTVLTFRRTFPIAQRPPDAFRAPGYPVVQILFVIISAAVVASVIGAAPAAAAKGAVLIALGIPVYYWYAHKH
jgi:APA family basic amino acid/polyamine antiporter